MRLATIGPLLMVGALWFALGSTPAPTQADQHKSTCETCGKKSTSSCPHCASGKECPHCDYGKDCPHCAHHGHHGHHGSWSGHQWEYKCVRPPKKPEEATKQLNALGADRWRLKAADGGLWCFSRVKPSN